MHGDDEVKYHDDLDGQDVGGHPLDDDPRHTLTCSNVDVQRMRMNPGDLEDIVRPGQILHRLAQGLACHPPRAIQRTGIMTRQTGPGRPLKAA